MKDNMDEINIKITQLENDMKYEINRYEHYRDNLGNIVSIFLAVRISNETDSTVYEYFLSPEERDLVLLDETNLKPVLEKCYAEAELKLEHEVATRPMPSIFPLEEEGKKETLETLHKLSEISKAKDKIKQEKLEKIRLEEARLLTPVKK